MQTQRNSLKAALQRGDPQYGIWLNLGAPLAAELAGGCGFDWCLIDGEHAAFDLGAIQSQLQALAISGTPGVVRLPGQESWMLKQVLDMGAQSVLVPMVETAEEAGLVASACRYPPTGTRGLGAMIARASGFGAQADYVAEADQEVCVMVQVESRRAVENIAEICAVPGVDVVFVGPADLAADMGYAHDLDHADVRAAVDAAIKAIVATGKPAGVLGYQRDRVREYRALGATFIGIGTDVGVYRGALMALKDGL